MKIFHYTKIENCIRIVNVIGIKLKNKFMENEEQILEILKENQETLKQTYESAEKTRKYFLYTAIATILMFVLPIIGLIIIIPMFLSSYLKGLDGLL